MPGKITLFCFHHAGGTERQFKSWDRQLTPSITVVGLPVENRFAREETIEDLALNALKRLDGYDVDSFAFYGHSMGGLVAYEVCRRLHNSEKRLPSKIIIGGTGAPQMITESRALQKLSLTNPTSQSVPRYVTQRTIAGVTRACNYNPKPLKIPVLINIITGSRDPLVGREEVVKWGDYSSLAPIFHEVSGDHFFHLSDNNEFFSLIQRAVLHGDNSPPLKAHDSLLSIFV